MIERDGFQVYERVYEPGSTLKRHAHARSLLSVTLNGGFHERIGRRGLDRGPGTLQLKPAHVEHADVYGPAGAATLIMEIPPHRAEQLALDEDAGRHAVRLTRPSAVALVERIRSEISQPDCASPVCLEGIALELLLLVAGCGLSGPRRRHAPNWLADVIEALEQNIMEPCATSDLARIANVHPAHLARTFRRYVGCTLGDYTRNRRLDRVADQLARTDLGIAELAMDWGFFDQAHMTRHFRRRFGVAPSRFRRQQS